MPGAGGAPGADVGALFGNPAMMSMMTGMMAQPGFLESIEAMNVRRGARGGEAGTIKQ